MGPGSDADSLRELRSGATLLWLHHYIPSRSPGYFPYEALCGLLYGFGGTIATNLATVAMSLMLLDSFLRVCEHFEVPHRELLFAAMAMHPVFWATSTSTIDFIWALAAFFLGFRLLLKDRYVGAAAMLGLAVGIRLSSILLCAPLLLWELAMRPRDSRIWATTAGTAIVGALLYLPEFIHAGNSISFLTYYVGKWNLIQYLGRFIYKNIYFWGLPAAIFIVAISPAVVRGLRRSDPKYAGLVVFSASTVIAFELLFLKLPVQRAYLLPMLPFALILFGISLHDRKPTLVALTILVISYNLVNFNLASPDIRDDATRARLGPFVEQGYLLSDVAARLQVRRNPIVISSLR